MGYSAILWLAPATSVEWFHALCKPFSSSLNEPYLILPRSGPSSRALDSHFHSHSFFAEFCFPLNFPCDIESILIALA